MKILSLIFHLGVLFSAFAFLWFWLQLLLFIALPEGIRNQIRYFLQLMQSLFLGTLVLKFIQMEDGVLAINGTLVLTMMTYFLYLIRNIQSEEKRIQVQFYSNIYKKLKTKNNWEWAVALISLGVTIIWVFYPMALDSVVTNWFYIQTHDVMEVPILGWIFKIAGFFFLLATLFRFIAALRWIIDRPTGKVKSKDQEYDDYEEL
jgi:hypothetical protein